MSVCPSIRWLHWGGAVVVLLLARPQPGIRAQAPQGQSNDADAFFRHLDSNGDGTITMADANDRNRRNLEMIFELAGKPTTESLSRAEFQKVFDSRRSGARPGNQRPAPPSDSEVPAPPVELRLTRAELARLANEFDRHDTNQDGTLDAAELQAALSARAGSAQGAGASRSTRPTPATPKNRPANPPSGTPTNPRTAAGSAAARSSATGLTGIWRGWVVNGRGENPNSGPMQMELRIEGNRIAARELGSNRAGEGLGEGVYEIAANGNSGNLDATGTGGPQAGQRFLGIFELSGNELRWCVGNRGRPRPQEYATRSGNYLMILRRQ